MPPNNSENSASQEPKESVNLNLNLDLTVSEREMLDPDEQVVTIVHRTVIGLILIYLEALAAVAALIALAVLAFPNLFSELSANSNMLLLTGAVFAIGLIFFILFLATYIYQQSKLIVTNKNLIQILQRGLFVRKVSRLSMSNVEDVSAEQNGFLPSIFGYGTLMVQTAGEMENFVFPYCPNPNFFATKILHAREAFVEEDPDSDSNQGR